MDYTIRVSIHGKSAKSKATISSSTPGYRQSMNLYSPFSEPWRDGVLHIRAKDDSDAWIYVEHLVLQGDPRPIAGQSYLRQCRDPKPHTGG